MAGISLKNIVGKKNDLAADILTIIDTLSTTIWVEDVNGKVLIGNPQQTSTPAFPVTIDDEILGWVKGDERGMVLASLLTHLAVKESEKKKLGTEVLSLYQEINVIFNFSEKLAQTIEPDAIAKVTLGQAMHSIPADSGVLVLWDDENRELEIPAIAGESLFNRQNISSNAAILLKIGLDGQSAIIDDLSVLKEKGIIENNVQSLMYAAMKVKHRIMGAIILAGKEAEQFSAVNLKMLVTLALQSSSAIESAMLYEKNIREVKEREEAILRIHEVTKKFVPNEFISSLGKERLTDVKLGDLVEKIVTVLFTDIRDFTSLSEQMTPEENFRFVSSFNECLGPVIRAHHGFINQYLGDSIMAIFPRHAEDALYAAIEMQKAVFEFNRKRALEGLPVIKAGIGMHTGPLIMGITGDEHRLDAATISDTVNTSARIESLTKYYKSPLLLSGDTLMRIDEQERFHVRHLGNVRLKGKHKALTIYECIDGHEQKELDKKSQSLSLFNEAINFYYTQLFENSIQLFRSVIESDPEDHTAIFFMERARKYLIEGIPENWTGAEEMINK